MAEFCKLIKGWMDSYKNSMAKNENIAGYQTLSTLINIYKFYCENPQPKDGDQ